MITITIEIRVSSNRKVYLRDDFKCVPISMNNDHARHRRTARPHHTRTLSGSFAWSAVCAEVQTADNAWRLARCLALIVIEITYLQIKYTDNMKAIRVNSNGYQKSKHAHGWNFPLNRATQRLDIDRRSHIYIYLQWNTIQIIFTTKQWIAERVLSKNWVGKLRRSFNDADDYRVIVQFRILFSII